MSLRISGKKGRYNIVLSMRGSFFCPIATWSRVGGNLKSIFLFGSESLRLYAAEIVGIKETCQLDQI